MRVLKPFDPWRSPLCTCPPKYTLNPYTGCAHACRYCYITSYIRDGFRARLKEGLLRNLRRDLAEAGRGITVALSYSSDPYTPPEGRLGVTRRVLELLMRHGARVLVATKSTLVRRDVDLLRRMPSAVSITVTTIDRGLAGKLEPLVPSPRARLRVVGDLVKADIPVSLRVDPIIPGLTDDYAMIEELIAAAASLGVRHIVASIYKVKPDNYRRMVEEFPEMERFWRRIYWRDGEVVHGYRYAPLSLRSEILSRVASMARRYGLAFNVCREGLPHLDSKGCYCDASHLLPPGG